MSNGTCSPWFVLNFGSKCAYGYLWTYTARSQSIPKPLYSDYALTTPRTNPVPLDGNGVAPECFLESGGYYFVVKDAAGNEMYTRDNVYPAASSLGLSLTTTGYVYYDVAMDTYSTKTAATDHKFLTDTTDQTPGFSADKFAFGTGLLSSIQGTTNRVLRVDSLGLAAATSGTSQGYLQDLLEPSSSVSITLDGNKLKFESVVDASLITGTTYRIPYFGNSGSGTGPLTYTAGFTFGDPSALAALYVPSIQAVSSITVGTAGETLWTSSSLNFSYATNGGTVQLTASNSSAYVYAHNNYGTAAIVADKAAFVNLENGGLVFAFQQTGTSEDRVFLHTQTGLSFAPTTGTLTTPILSTGTFTISSLTTAGVLVNDASGNITSTPASTFASDHLVSMSSTDTVPGYLGTKLGAGTNIGFSTTTDADGQKLWISARSNMLLVPTYIQADYTVIDTDTLVAYNGTGTNVTVTLPTPGQSYDGRGIYFYSTASNATITISGTTAGVSAYFTGIGLRYVRCLKMPDGTYRWIVWGV